MTKEPVRSDLRLPTGLVAKLSSYALGTRKGEFGIGPCDVRIYGDDREPLWFEHPSLGSRCDLIALPMERPKSCPNFMHNAANRISSTRIPIEPGSTVFIIGFPQAISVGIGLPLWKSGYIASEPWYDVTIGGKTWQFGGLQGGIKLPAFFIDSQTREGMSGSPVFARFQGSWDMENPYRPIDLKSPEFWKRDDVAIFGSRRHGTCWVLQRANHAKRRKCSSWTVLEKKRN